jgi:hypothetical protein
MVMVVPSQKLRGLNVGGGTEMGNLATALLETVPPLLMWKDFLLALALSQQDVFTLVVLQKAEWSNVGGTIIMGNWVTEPLQIV